MNFLKTKINFQDPVARIIDTIATGHQLKSISMNLNSYYAITCGFDGFTIIRNSDFNKTIGITLAHHRRNGGVQKAYTDPYKKYVISLGKDNVLTCTNLTTQNEPDSELRDELNDLLNSTKYLFTDRRTIGFYPQDGKFKGKSWIEYKEIVQRENERTLCAIERTALLSEFKAIQTDLQQLLTENLVGPNNEKLDILEFNLDVQMLEEKTEINKKLCNATDIYSKELIQAQNEITRLLIETFWDTISVPSKVIQALYKNFEVDNYALLPINPRKLEQVKLIEERRKLEKYLAGQSNTFQPWIPIDERYKPHTFANTKAKLSIIIII